MFFKTFIFVVINEKTINKHPLMTEQEFQEHLKRLRNFYQQLHLTVLYEDDFITQLGSRRNLFEYRDNILDNINIERNALGYI